MTLYQGCKLLLLAGLCLFIGALVAHTLPLLDELRVDTAAVSRSAVSASTSLQIALTHIAAIETDTQRTEAEMAGLLNQTRHSMMTPAQTKELVDRAANLMDNANLATIRLGEAANSLQGIGPTTQGAIAEIAQDAHVTMASAQETLKAATADVADPAIKQSLANLQDATNQTAAATKNLADTTADIKLYVHRETTPVRGFWHGIKWLINSAWSVRGAAGL